MTGPEHYREAERLLVGCKTQDGALLIEEGTAEVLAAAQVHATLALAAATALLSPVAAGGYDDDRDLRAWRAAAGKDHR
ncbi:hypothetical protein [Microtetraspora niveoalba]|uniref:hypothetical protein n=1 Tax=Microtetraspora niveoalba TaxID=46175 RepID=UPI0009FF3640|nr:hypothetical protein [Microtetraspora niveoalba]